jgi:hypothetical protein
MAQDLGLVPGLIPMQPFGSEDGSRESVIGSHESESIESESEESQGPDDNKLNPDSVSLIRHHLIEAEIGNLKVTKNTLLELLDRLEPPEQEDEEDGEEGSEGWEEEPEDGSDEEEEEEEDDLPLTEDIIAYLKATIKSHTDGFVELSKNSLRAILYEINPDYEDYG